MKENKTIVLASNNAHKIEEFKQIFADYNIVSLKDIGFFEDIEETGTTFFENSLIKATAVHKFLTEKGIIADVLADDSGLCVDALDGAPGVYSARYAGEHDNAANRRKLLKELSTKNDRSAHFTCCLVYMFADGSYIHQEGYTFGTILTEETGDNSFGYDCLFCSADLGKSFGLCTHEEKNSVSHRGRAIEKLLKELKKQ
ncbi:MAG: RdgB/HAM1 family non-canonical purine NTP pyrophosphatase [Clostridia bacterium]|nr:RdgB/HAM1 family non-canonical purine NTP pyrophosphatase [Clostridia bacterium]